jgi:hypothetical protein
MRRASEENGATLVIVAIWLPLIIVMGLFVVDAANLFVHKRHLQVQADAAVLAASQDIGVVGNCDEATLENTVQSYGGLNGSTINAQIGGTPASRVLWALNSTTYPRGGDTDTTVDTRVPCAGTMIDLKLSEVDLPRFTHIAGIGITDHVNAHARVSFKTASTSKGMRPFTALDFQAKNVEAQMIDEDTGTALTGWFQLDQKNTGAPAGTAYSNSTATNVPVGAAVKNVGVRVRVTTGASTVTTYDATASNAGVTHIQGYNVTSTGTPSSPEVRSALLNGSASCPYSDAYFESAACTTTMSVDLAMNSTAQTCNDVTNANKMGVVLRAFVNGTNTATFSCTSVNTTTHVVSFSTPANAAFNAAPNAGPNTISLHYQAAKTNPSCNSGCTAVADKSLGTVQKAYLASTTRSGPIRDVQVTDYTTPPGTSLANSLQACATCTYPLIVTVSLPNGLDSALSGSTNQAVNLRTLSGPSNQTQLVDCPTTGPQNAQDQVLNGCLGQYAINTNGCPDVTTPPTTCIQPKPGNVTSLDTGLNQLMYGESNSNKVTCPVAGARGYNNWGATIPPNDPRIVEVFIADYGQFAANGGSQTIPIRRFAAFYVTDWNSGQKTSTNPCPPTVTADKASTAGDVVGHFIKYVNPDNGGSGSSGACVPTSIDLCFAALTL